MNNKPMAIALAADIAYEAQLTTLLKSLCFHHTHLKIYLFHKTFSKGWFDNINQKLARFNSCIETALVQGDFNAYPRLEHVSEATYYRFLCANLPEERVLYLDCDMVIDGDLSELYHTPFNDSALLAVEDFILNNTLHYSANLKPYFNAGVMLINSSLWRQHQLSQKLFQLSDTYSDIENGDQDILNFLLCKKWKELDCLYNYQVGSIMFQRQEKQLELIEQKNWLETNPTIIHYNLNVKPWTNSSKPPFAERYWLYHSLDWNEISNTK